MPVIEYFAYTGPNRRSDKPVVEVTLNFRPGDVTGFPQHVSEIRDLLISGGILSADEVFPEQVLPAERMTWYASLLAQTALLFQRKTGHGVNYFSVTGFADENRCRALLEHEHCDVGMTAVKLACELLSGERKQLAEPFKMFSNFAKDRLLPLETGAIIKAAHRRDIPVIQLDRFPFKRADFDGLTGARCIRPNGLLMLGHGEHQCVLDGTYCISSSEDFAGLFDSGKQNASPRLIPANLDSAAEALLDRLFPVEESVRMPTIAITGTNGKTTTTRMTGHIMSVAGRKPGMVCTDGIFLNGEILEKGDICSRVGHLKVLTSKEVNVAVLETHQAGILTSGFAFRFCDIAVCLNVSEDHLGEVNIDTVEQMAEVKRALPERAKQAVVLNADDPHCHAMFDKVTAKQKCLVSMNSSREQLHALHGNGLACCCVLEMIDGRQWLVIYDKQLRLPLMTVDSIPATFAGAAHFMVSNAMHAITASYLSGVSLEVIKTVMISFDSSYDSTPGRLNVFDDLPFRIIMDFAHNPDGMHRFCEFIDRQNVTGRKLVAFAASTNRKDETIVGMGHSLAGHFDFYFCKEHIHQDGKKHRKVAGLLKQGLIEEGVAESQIAVKTSGKNIIFEIFDACQPGDLLVMLMGHVESPLLPGYIREYAGITSTSR